MNPNGSRVDCDSKLITLISYNVRGIKSNSEYVCYLLSSYCPLILCFSEHWLHSFEVSIVSDLFGNFNFVVATIEEPHALVPKHIRGRSGVAIVWSPVLNDHISPILSPKNDRIVGIRVDVSPTPLAIFSVYLPCRTGGTDPFKSVMDELDSLLSLFPGHVVIFSGDFNADPGCSSVNHHPPNEQGIILNRCLTKWDYVSVHLQSPLNPSGSFMTHESEAHGTFSIIDHILCPKYFLSEFVSASIGVDHPLNSSDHLPVISSIDVVFNSVSSCSQVPSGSPSTPCNWAKCDSVLKNWYANSVGDILPSVPSVLVLSVTDIEDIVTSVTQCLLSSDTQLLPLSRFCKHVRSDWNSFISHLHLKSKNAYQRWVKSGRVSDPANAARRLYKEAKSVFRRELRKLKRQEVDRFYSSLDLSDRNIYHHVRRKRGTVSSGTNELIVGDSRYEGPHVRDGWGDYFEMLACPASQGFSQSHAASVDTQLLSILLSNSSIDHPPVIITCDMVVNAIQSLAFKKAAGPDGLSAEHFVYGPVDSLATILALVFQAMISSHYIPHSFRLAYIVPILKGRSLDPSNPSNYRGISVGSTFCKVFEYILLSEFLSPLSHRLHALQGGFRSGLSTSHTSYILNECIMSCRERNSKCYT